MIGPEDFVHEAALPHIVAPLEENTHRATEKTEEWEREAQLQEELLDAMDSDEENDF
jgi:hypothetical protein